MMTTDHLAGSTTDVHLAEMVVSTLAPSSNEYSRLCIDPRTGSVFLLRKGARILDIFDPISGDFETVQLSTRSEDAIEAIGDIAWDHISSSILLTDFEAHCVLSLNPRDGKLSHLAGIRSESGDRDGTLKEAMFNKCDAIDVAPNGKIYVTDYGNDALKEIDREKNKVTKLGHISKPFSCSASEPGKVYSSEAGARIRKFDLQTKTSEILAGSELHAGECIDGTAGEAGFRKAYYLAPDREDSLYVCDTGWIRKILPDGFVKTLCGVDVGQGNRDDEPPRKDGAGSEAILRSFICLKLDKPRDILYFIDGSDENAESSRFRRMLLPTRKKRENIANSVKSLTEKQSIPRIPPEITDILADFCYRRDCSCYDEAGSRIQCRNCMDLPRFTPV